MDDLDGIAASVIDLFNNFDPGMDENDVAAFFAKANKVITENLEKGATGNNQISSYLKAIFGENIFDDLSGENYGQEYEARVN
jgi:hypothetical protein